MTHRQDGQALLTVLVAMLILQLMAWAFLSAMGIEQRLAGGSARSLAAFYLADAGMQKTLEALEEGSSDASGGSWPVPHREALGDGAFTLETIDRLPGGLISIDVTGEVAGARRRLRALARVGPEALGYGLYGQDIIGLYGQARTYLLPSRSGVGGCRCSGGLAAGGEIRLGARTTLNTFRGRAVSGRDGTVIDYNLLGPGAFTDPSAGLVDLVLAGGARLVVAGGTREQSEALRQQADGLGIRSLRTRPALPMLSIDMGYYRALAEVNIENAAINAAAGSSTLGRALRAKVHSRYTAEEFWEILVYLRDRPGQALRGVIFVEGDVYLADRIRLSILDGALVMQGNLEVGDGASLEVRHSLAARTLPGVIAWTGGTILIDRAAAAMIDGLLLAERDIEVRGGLLDVAGAVAAMNVFSTDGTVVVRYDARVPATEGLRRTGKGVVVLLSWLESP